MSRAPERPEAARPTAADSTTGAEPEQIRRYREMGQRGRLAAALDLNAALDQLALAGRRARHGAASARQERLWLFSFRLGRQDMVNAFGWDPRAEGR